MLSVPVVPDCAKPIAGLVSPPSGQPAPCHPAWTLWEGGLYRERPAKHAPWKSAPVIEGKARRGARGKALRGAPLAVTRLRSAVGMEEKTAPFSQQCGFLVQLSLSQVSPVRLWLGGREAAVDPVQTEGSVSILAFEQEPALLLGSAFDLMQFYVSRAALDEFADENEGGRCATLAWPFGKVDPELHKLAACLLPALEQPGLGSELYVDHLLQAVLAYIARIYGGFRAAPSMVRGGLAPWQLQRATELLRANLDGQIALPQVARECKLSVSHFVRAFKQTVGQPPYRWLLQQRMETAKNLLLHSGLPMVEIALKCGFADQACFIRAFRKLLGATPGEWRRIRMQ